MDFAIKLLLCEKVPIEDIVLKRCGGKLSSKKKKKKKKIEDEDTNLEMGFFCSIQLQIGIAHVSNFFFRIKRKPEAIQEALLALGLGRSRRRVALAFVHVEWHGYVHRPGQATAVPLSQNDQRHLSERGLFW